MLDIFVVITNSDVRGPSGTYGLIHDSLALVAG